MTVTHVTFDEILTDFKISFRIIENLKMLSRLKEASGAVGALIILPQKNGIACMCHYKESISATGHGGTREIF